MAFPGGGNPSVLDANYPPQLTVGRRPLGRGGGSGRVGWGGGPGGAVWGVGVGEGGTGSAYLPLPSI